MNLDSEEVYGICFAYTFIQETDHIRIGKIEEGLDNKFSRGVNSYTCNLSNTKNMVIHYKNYVYNPNRPDKKNKTSKKYLEK